MGSHLSLHTHQCLLSWYDQSIDVNVGKEIRKRSTGLIAKNNNGKYWYECFTNESKGILTGKIESF